MRSYKVFSTVLAALLAEAAVANRSTQNPIDRADPAVVEQELDDPRERTDRAEPAPLIGQTGAATTALARSVRISAIEVEGAFALSPAAYQAAARPFIGRELSASDLRQLASAVAGLARHAGFGLATAWIPEQTIADGTLRLRVDEGRLEDFAAAGPAADTVERMLSPLVDGRPVRTSRLERRLLLAGDIPGITIGQARLERRQGRNVLVVRTWLDRAEGRAVLENWGTRTVGPVRAQVAASFNQVLTSRDRLTLGAVGTVPQIEEFRLLRAAYEHRVGGQGTIVSVSGYAAWSEPGGVLADRDFDGRSLEVAAGISHPALRGRSASLWTDLEFSVRDAQQKLRGQPFRDDRLSLLRASGFLVVNLGETRLRTRLTLTQGLGLFEATRAGDPLASRADGSAVFTKIDLWSRVDVPLGGPFSLQLAGEGQAASRPLLSSEEIGLGGRYLLRGYDFREMSGDQGVAGGAELRFNIPHAAKPFKNVQLYAFGDAGHVADRQKGRGGGTLASAGGGVRFLLPGWHEAAFEVGLPLKKGAFGKPRDPRLSFVVSARF